MMSLTTSEVAALLGVSQQWVKFVAKREGLGRLINSRCRVLTPRDVAAIRRHVGKRKAK